MDRDRQVSLGPDVQGSMDVGATYRTPEPSIGELLSRITSDTSELVRAEMKLARAELRQMGSTVAKDAAKVGVGLGLGLAGALALVAFLVIAVGDLLNNYWLGALLVGLVFAAVGALLARNAVADVKRRGLKPERTIESLQETTAWAKRELADVKQELTR